MSERVHLFSNGSQFMDWESRNCNRCVRRCRDDLAAVSPCELQNIVWQASWGEGSFDPEDAKRLGYTEPGKYTWKCPGFDDDPGRWCAHCLRPIETEDALIISERCDNCGGSLASPGSVLEKGDIIARKAEDDRRWSEAEASGLIVPRTGEAAPSAPAAGEVSL